MKRNLLFTLFTLALGLLLAACSAPSAAAPVPTVEPTRASGNGGTTLACATQNHAALDAFRPDPVSKLTASSKPKLIEFFAFW